MSAAKKSKMSQEAELDAVRQHLLECPNVPKDSRALQVALGALDQERKRMERDAKLQRKFANTSSSKSTSSTETTQSNNNKSSTTAYTSASFVKPARQQPPSLLQQQDEDAELMEWQDVAPSQEHIVEAPLEGSVLGKVLAQSSIADMASSKTTVASPLGAAALALHAALCGDVLGFKCTGIPNEGPSKGFAAPIRELPKTQLVPKDWDKNSVSAEHPSVKLRYRKDGVGSTVLNVALKDENTVHVEFVPSSTNEPHVLTFALNDHVNLDSLSKALASQGRVVPTLHYKALAVLLTNMCNTFDLGPVKDSDAAEMTSSSSALPYVDTTIVPPTDVGQQPIGTTTGNTRPLRRYDPYERPNIRIFQPEMRRPGDFDRDLLPGGVDNPAGNLMGPNHPAFGGLHPAVGGGYGMRPRFDPYGPPGGPTDPSNVLDPNRTVLDPNDPRNNRQGGPRHPHPPPGGTGDPNPDHERPPNNLSNNMFM